MSAGRPAYADLRDAMMAATGGAGLTLAAIAADVGKAVAAEAPHHPGFMIWNPEGQAPRLRHLTLPQAQGEARRLAEANPGQDFFVLAPVLHARAPKPRATLRLAPEPVAPLRGSGRGFMADGQVAFEDDMEIPF